MNFTEKIFLTLYSINWPNFIIWSSFLLEVLGKMCIFICCPFCDVMNLKLALVFWPSHFPTRPKAKQAFKCLKNVKRFLDEMKRIFHHFWRALFKVSKTIVIRNGLSVSYDYGKTNVYGRRESDFNRTKIKNISISSILEEEYQAFQLLFGVILRN